MNVSLSRGNLSFRSGVVNLDLSLGRRRPGGQSSGRQPRPAAAQTRHFTDDPFARFFNTYQPLKHNLGLFSLLRSEIPFFNVAIRKLVMLIGDPVIRAESKRVQKSIDAFRDGVQVNEFGQGLGAFLDELEDSTFEFGMGWGELIPTASMTDVWGLKIARASDLRFITDEKTGRLVLATYSEDAWRPVQIQNPDLIYYLAFDRRQGHPQGYSLLYSCVTPGQIFMRWEKSFENNVIRVGDPTHFVTIKAGENTSKEEAEYIRDDVLGKISEVMQLRKKGQYGDVGVCVPHGGEAEQGVLGSDARFWNTESQVRTILEQLIANTGLPPSSLGVSWATTERMSQMQNDVLQSNIKAQRERITPIVRRIIDTFLTLTGSSGAAFEVDWPDVILLDETEKAKARLWNWKATRDMLDCMNILQEKGFATDESIEHMLRSVGFDATKLPRGWQAKAKDPAVRSQLARQLSAMNA